MTDFFELLFLGISSVWEYAFELFDAMGATGYILGAICILILFRSLYMPLISGGSDTVKKKGK